MKKGLIITLGVIGGLVILAFIIRGINLSRKANNPETEETVMSEFETELPDATETPEIEETTQKPTYDSTIDKEDNKDKAIIKNVASYEYEPFKLKQEIWGTAVVPETLVNGSSFIKYYEALTPEMFNFSFGTALTQEDATATIQYCIGTDTSKSSGITKDYLHSMQWLYNKLNFMEGNTSIYFANLHVIGQVGTDMTLCMFDWDSVTTMSNTLVLVKGLDTTKRGDVISFATYRHNISSTVVSAQKVLLIDYRKEY